MALSISKIMVSFLIFYWIFATLFHIGLIVERESDYDSIKWWHIAIITLLSGIIMPIGLGVALGKKISSYDK